MVVLIPLLHLGALAALARPALGPILFALFGWAVGQLSLALGYHRLFSHASYQARPWLRYLLAFLSVQTLQGGIISWAAVHRKHHGLADTDEDPHSPRHGFWWAYWGWMFHEIPARSDPGVRARYCPDLLKDPGLVFFEKTHLIQVALVAWLLYALGGWAWLLWGFFVRVCLVMHATNTVSSFCHGHGYRNHRTADLSTNNFWVNLITFGEGWHNNHHHRPGSARMQYRWWEFDPGWWLLRAFERLGWIRDLRR